MGLYVRVDWPESQEWMGGEYDDEIEYGQDAGIVFVPEELYNEVNRW